MAKADDPYGTYGGIPDVLPGGGGGRVSGVRADINDAGGQVFSAMQKLGENVQQIEQKYRQQAQESKVNDEYANKYIPSAIELKNQYNNAPDKDKVQAYDNYINGLNALNKSLVQAQPTEYGRNIMNGQLSRHYASEVESAKLDLLKSQDALAVESSTAKIYADTNYAALNYNNPQIVEQSLKSSEAMITIRNMDRGLDPNKPEDMDIIDEEKRELRGNLADGMINTAMSKGDINSAYKIRANYNSSIPGYKQIAIDQKMDQEALRQSSINGAKALTQGQPIPQMPGAPPIQVQAVVADVSHSKGIDQNHALTVAYIESNMGQNLGKRGDIGQTGKGGDLHQQANNMVDELKKSSLVAEKALGRKPSRWEEYTCYQQGAGGGPALLKAAIDNPTAKAVDVLLPLYKNPKDARDAILHNGGNVTMTSGDFLQLIKKKYEMNEARARCEITPAQVALQPTPEGMTSIGQPQASSLGNSIINAHSSFGEVVQPSDSPRGRLNNFLEKYPQMLERANAIPNMRMKEAILKKIDDDKRMLEASSSAYSNSLIYKAQKYAADPNFTSMDQIDSDTLSAIYTESPKTIDYLERKIEDNINNIKTPPLDFNNISSIPQQLALRFNDKDPLTPGNKMLRKKDIDSLNLMWDQQTAGQKLAFLSDLSQFSKDNKTYSNIVQAVRPDSPVTQMAGMYLSLDRSMAAKTHVFKPDELEITPDSVALRLIQGEDLLNQSKLDKKEGGTGRVFPMPPDSLLNSDFSNHTHDAFRNNPQAQSVAYQAYRAYYAAEAASQGVYNSAAVDSKIAERSAKAVVGGVTEMNDKYAIMPWGMEETEFRDKVNSSLSDIVKVNGLNPDFINIDNISLENNGYMGSYRINVGQGYLLDKEGNPVILTVTE